MTGVKKRAPNRYPDDSVAALLEAQRLAHDNTVEDMAELLGFSTSSWYKKVEGVTPFKVEEVGRCASFWSMPAGWPFVQVTLPSRQVVVRAAC